MYLRMCILLHVSRCHSSSLNVSQGLSQGLSECMWSCAPEFHAVQNSQTFLDDMLDCIDTSVKWLSREMFQLCMCCITQGKRKKIGWCAKQCICFSHMLSKVDHSHCRRSLQVQVNLSSLSLSLSLSLFLFLYLSLFISVCVVWVDATHETCLLLPWNPSPRETVRVHFGNSSCLSLTLTTTCLCGARVLKTYQRVPWLCASQSHLSSSWVKTLQVLSNTWFFLKIFTQTQIHQHSI